MINIVTVITIPLVVYHGKIYWCLYDEHTGKIREDLLNRPTGGKQIQFAFEQALRKRGNILIVVDDKFTFEKNVKKFTPPSDSEVNEFIKKNPLPKSWLEELKERQKMDCIFEPHKHLKCSEYSYSEKRLLEQAKKDHYELPGECANEWTVLLDYLSRSGFDEIHAYIPKFCAKGICYATPYAQESGIYENPIVIDFTDKDNVITSLNFEFEKK